MEAVVEGEKYFVSKSTSYANWLILLRGFLVDGKPDAASAMFRNNLKVYPLSRKGSPPKMEFTNGSRKFFNTIHANDYEFSRNCTPWSSEPVSTFDPELRGTFAAIGIEKGKPFAPDARMKKILTEAVAIGNATARAISFHPRDPEAAIYPDSAWTSAFIGGDYQWLADGGKGGRNLDARTLFFYQAHRQHAGHGDEDDRRRCSICKG